MNLEATFSFWNPLAATWLQSAVSGLFAVLIVSALCAVIGRYLSASLRCYLWWLICLQLSLATVGGLFGLPSLRIPVSTGKFDRYRTRVPALFPPPTNVGAGGNPVLPILSDGVKAQPVKSPVSTLAPARSPRPAFATYMLLFWSGGVLISLIWAGRAIYRLHRLLRTARDLSATPLGGEMREMAVQMGVATPPRLVETAATAAPFVIGLRRPVLAVPIGFAESLSPDEMRMALAHELAHLRRGDLYFALAPFAVRILCFCVPLVPRWICAEWATAREADCDARAMQATQAAPGAYSRLLIKIVRADAAPLPAPLTVLGATSAFHTLHTRLRLIRDRSEMRGTASAARFLFVLLALCVIVPWHLVPANSIASKERSIPLAPLVPLPVIQGSEDIADVSAYAAFAEADPDKRYLLIGARADATPPPNGYRLLIVLPGGDGSADFNYFVRRLRKRALGDGYIVAELIAKSWDARQFQEVVWPTETNPYPAMRFSTEQFVDAVARDVQARFPIDRRQIFTLSWASGGPAGYAVSLRAQTPVVGSFIAMSVFPTDTLPPLTRARGQVYFLLHPEDAPFVPAAVAQRAESQLRQNGAHVELVTYPGGYGWNGDVYAQVRRGVHYLEEQTQSAAK